MVFQLKRKIATRDCVIGELTCDTCDIKLYTKEYHLPGEGFSYKTLCLPPDIYPVRLVFAPMTIEGLNLYVHWALIEKIHFFPHAGFLPAPYDNVKGGRIQIGTELIDDFNIGGRKEATRLFIRMCKSGWNDGNPADATALVVEENHDEMVFRDYTEAQHKVMQEDELKNQQRKLLYKEIYGEEGDFEAGD